MSYAVMPLSDYKAACDKVREKVDLTTVRFEDTDFGYIRSAVFTAKESGEYIFTVEVKDESKLNIYGIYYAVPEWEDNSSPGMFNVIDEKTLSVSFIKGETVRIFISDYDGLKASDIVFATLSHNGEVVENFVEPPKIKSGELAEKVDEVYMAGASDFGLKGKGQGELVHFENVHPIEHKVEVGLGSKNLFNEDKANITKTEDYFSSNVPYWQGPCLTIPVESGATYTCSCEYYTPNTTTFNTFLAYSISTEKTYTSAAKALVMRLKTQSSAEGYSKVKDTFTVPDGIEEVYFLTDNEGSGTFFKNFQIEKGTPTAYAPFVADFSDCKVKVIGKNLFDKTDYIRHSDGTIGFSVKNLVEGETYTISTNIPIKQFKVSNAPWGYSSGSAHNDNGFAYHTWKHTRVEQISESATLYIHFTLVGETSMVSDISQLDGYEIQIECGTTPSEYTEYIEPTEYTANADGTVEGIKSISPVMNISTDKAGAVIDAECFLDPQAVITDLTNTVITLGGEV